MNNPSNAAVLRFRLLFGAGSAFGPGKADLLEAIRDGGSIAAAGRTLGMSYKRAWQLVEELNSSFRGPLIDASKGGHGGGGAHLTALGLEVLQRFRAIEQRLASTLAVQLRGFARLAQPPHHDGAE